MFVKNIIVKNTNPADIPPTLELQRQLEKCKNLYIDCLVNNNPIYILTNENPKNNTCSKIDNCDYIYKENIKQIVKQILEEDKYKKYYLLNYPRFKELIWNAENKTNDFLRDLEY
jgi:hypothetical protein